MKLFPDRIDHVYNRGNRKQRIFFTPGYFPFFIPPPLWPPPFIPGLPDLGDINLLFFKKGLTVLRLGASGLGFFAAGCSFGVGSFLSSDMTRIVFVPAQTLPAFLLEVQS